MKRFFALTIAALLVLSLAACGGAPATTPTAGEIETTASTDAAAEAGITFEELSVYESDMCSIVITGIDANNPSGYVLNLSISNNTEAEEVVNIEYIYEQNEDGEYEVVEEVENVETISTTLEFVLVSAKINGTEVEASFSTDAESGMRNYDQLVFDAALIDTLGDFTEIELSFRVFDIESPETDIAVATAIVYPYGDPNLAE